MRKRSPYAALLQRAVLLVAMLSAFVLPVRADDEPDDASRVERAKSFHSMALSAPLRYSIYLPPGYDPDEGPGYPTIYLLHGWGQDGNSWIDSGKIKEVADKLIETGALPPTVIVMPFAQVGWYVDSASPQGTGRWQTAILDDLITFIDARYHTIPEGGYRAVGGFSMGGYGALRFALMEPDEFAAAASLSGALFPDVKSAADFPAFQLNLFGNSFGEKFDPMAFNAASPWRKVSMGATGLPAIYMSVGDRDIAILAAGNEKFVAALKAARIPVSYSVVPGQHNWELWSKETPAMLAFLGQRLKRAQTVAQTAPVPQSTKIAAQLGTPQTIVGNVKNAATPPGKGAAIALPPVGAPAPGALVAAPPSVLSK